MTKLSTTPRLEDAPCLTEAECLLIDPRADQDALFDQAESRLEAASNLMFYALPNGHARSQRRCP